jgi:C-terminal processing protease CtpA/Prc
MRTYIKYLIITAAAGILILSCERNFIDPPPNNLTRDLVLEHMKKWYLWYDLMPDVSTGDYAYPSALLDALLNKPTDRWSYIVSTEVYNSYYQDGEYVGHGFGLKYDADDKLRVTFTYDGTTAQSQGVQRGWELVSINGETITPESELDTLLGVDSVGVENSFSFLDLNQQTVNLILTKETVDINSVLYSDVISLDTSTVGYLVYQQFLSTSTTELDDVFSGFLDEGVEDVIVDLRYNPGGDITAARHLGSLLAGDYAVKRTFVKLIYNDKNSDRDLSLSFQEPDYMLDPTPERLFFIATGSSASASELVINSLRGLSGTARTFDIFIIGDDTYGKPVGSVAHRYKDSTLVPITFKYSNRLDEGDFYDGLTADSYVEEDITIPFGDPDEKLLKEVLYYIENGTFTGAVKKKAAKGREIRLRGIQGEAGAI